MKHMCHEAGEPKKTLMLHCDSVAKSWHGTKVGAEVAVATASHGREKVGDEACVPTESNIADIGTKGLASDRTLKLMNQMRMSLTAGVECLVQQPVEIITVTSILDRGMNQTMRRLSTR